MLNSGSSRSKLAGAGPSFGRELAAVVSCTVVLCSNGFVWSQTCGTYGQFCSSNGGCDDGNPCNGTETCSPPDIIRICRCDPTPPCVDGDPCTQDVCTVRHGVVCSHPPVVCDDGLYCNGSEVCVTFIGGCLSPPAPCQAPLLCDEAGDRCVECLTDTDCADGTDCTIDTCDIVAGSCEHRWCIDNLFCNGRELCRPGTGCLPGIPLCADAGICDEATDQCADCEVDADCADDDPCSIETCDADRLACRHQPCLLAFRNPPDGSIFLVDEIVEVTGVGARGLDLALVFDESGSIDSDEFSQLKQFAISLVDVLPGFAGNGAGTRVGVSMFSTGSRRILDLNGNRAVVHNAIDTTSPFGGLTCIGCGIDDGADNLVVNGRLGATQMMVVLTDGFNNLPPTSPALHLAGALEATAIYGHVLIAVGVGDASLAELDQIATDVPGVQTRFYVSQFSQLHTILNAILAPVGNGAPPVVATMPDGSQFVAPVDGTGVFALPRWSIMPGENLFTVQVNTLYGPRNASLTLIGVYPCANRCGDLTGDGAVDLRDVAVFQNCFGGPSYSSAACACADLNGDTDINLFDLPAFVSALISPTKQLPPDCPAP